MARSCSLLLRTLKPEAIPVVVDKQNVWPCPFGVLPLWSRLAPSLKDGDQRNHLRGFHSVNLGHYQSRRPRVGQTLIAVVAIIGVWWVGWKVPTVA